MMERPCACIELHRVSPRVQSYIVSLFNYVIKTVSLCVLCVCVCVRVCVCVCVFDRDNLCSSFVSIELFIQCTLVNNFPDLLCWLLRNGKREEAETWKITHGGHPPNERRSIRHRRHCV